MIAPNRRKRTKTQDGRPLRRYRRRWKVERLFVWLQSFRRLVVRYEFHAENFLAMAQLGCIIILLRLIMRRLLHNEPVIKSGGTPSGTLASFYKYSPEEWGGRQAFEQKKEPLLIPARQVSSLNLGILAGGVSITDPAVNRGKMRRSAPAR